MKKTIAIIFLVLLYGCTQSEVKTTPKPTLKIEHTYFKVGDLVEDYNAIYTINNVIESKLESKEGFKWVIVDIDFYKGTDEDEDGNPPLCYMVHENQYYNGYSQSIKIANDSKINTKVLFEVPASLHDFNFYTDYYFAGNNSNIDDESRSIVRITL